jgi:hypothetical protein
MSFNNYHYRWLGRLDSNQGMAESKSYILRFRSFPLLSAALIRPSF